MKGHLGCVWPSIFVVSLLVTTGPPCAGDVVETDIAGLPAYARVERPFLYHTDEWAIITWYRSPEWLLANRRSFNLLNLFDVPHAFDAPLMVEGYLIWDPPAPVPIRMSVRELPGMPAWVVAWPELQAALANDRLTIGELLRMDSLRIGECTFYHETLHPIGTDDPVMHQIVANGVLGDGATFQYHYAHGELHEWGANHTVDIRIWEP